MQSSQHVMSLDSEIQAASSEHGSVDADVSERCDEIDPAWVIDGR